MNRRLAILLSMFVLLGAGTIMGGDCEFEGDGGWWEFDDDDGFDIDDDFDIDDGFDDDDFCCDASRQIAPRVVLWQA
jgi:hypothetical protein